VVAPGASRLSATLGGPASGATPAAPVGTLSTDGHAAAPLSPSLVQRDFVRILRTFGTPAQPSKRRGYSPGRVQGMDYPQRERQTVVVKAKKRAKSATTD